MSGFPEWYGREEAMDSEITSLRARAEKAEAEVAEWRTAAMNAADERNDGEQVHCTCVGPLRVEIERLREAACLRTGHVATGAAHEIASLRARAEQAERELHERWTDATKYHALRARVLALLTKMDAIHTWPCQECGIDQTDEWRALREAVEGGE